MDKALWPALREYIAAEIKLAIARRDMHDDGRVLSISARQHLRDREIPALEEQSTRMETALREGLPERIS